MTDESKAPLPLVGKIFVSIMAAFFIAMTGAGVLLREPEMVVVGLLVVVTLAWTVGAVEGLRRRTTARLSRSQVLAVVLIASLIRVGGELLVASDLLEIQSVGVLGLAIWFVWSLRRNGWSKR